MTRSSGNASVHERTLVKIQDSLEQALSGIREELQKMEQVVERLREALFQVDLLLANPSSALRYVSNPVCLRGLLSKSLSPCTARSLKAHQLRLRFSFGSFDREARSVGGVRRGRDHG
jgi:hypothetical protein